jgi:NadR type nicotinamide-nucleotide adenylyltransferase
MTGPGENGPADSDGPSSVELAIPPGVARVVVIGSECTGKTELAEWLAGELDVPSSAEYAREYAERRHGGAALAAADVEPIARGQLAIENRAIEASRPRAMPLVLHDTDLLSTRVYATAYYGETAVPAWLRRATLARRADLYLFCDIDVPWAMDAVRDAEADRERMQRQFAAALAMHGAATVTVSGDRSARRETALAAIRALTVTRG